MSAGHTGHALVAIGFTVVALAGTAAVEELHRRRQQGRPSPDRKAVLVAMVGVVSAGIHAAVLAGHWRESVTYGLFFLAAAAAQVALSAAVLVSPARRWLQADALLSIALLAVWLQSRTAGVPLGPARGLVEPVGLLDAVSSAAELLVVVLVVALLRRPAAGADRALRTAVSW